MKNRLLSIPFSSLSILFLLFASSALAQQNIISDVDNTHPEVDRLLAEKEVLTQFAVREGNNCNEISWAAVEENQVRKYIVEYTTNGVDFQTAGEVTASNRPYLLKHYFNYEHPIMYRLRIEQLSGQFFTSRAIPTIGYAGTRFVEIYPTIVTGNTLNMNAGAPVEKVNIFSTNGILMYQKYLGGERDRITLVLPTLPSGVYFMVISGKYWKSTEKFIIQ